MTVQELKTRGPSARMVRVAGTIVEGSIAWEARESKLEFIIADEGGALQVSHHGPRPNMLRGGAEAVVEGRYSADGTFEAHAILLKCPSKYRQAP